MAKPKSALEEMAETIRKKHQGQLIGSIALWGAMPVQPGDTAYAIGEVRVNGDALEVELSGRRLVVQAPANLTSKADSLVIADAAAVSWGEHVGKKKAGQPAVRLEKY